MGSAAAIALCLPMAAHAQSADSMQSQINDLSAQLKVISAKLQAVEGREARERAAVARQQAGTAALEARQEHEEAQIVAHNKAAQVALQAVSPTRSEKQGIVNNQFVTKGVLPGSFLVPGTNTSVYIGGFVNLQGEYNPTQNFGPKFSIGNLQPNGPSRRATAGDFQFNSKVSRLVVQSSTPSPLGPITTNFAIDLWGYVAGGDYNQALQNNSYSARIVYAYGTLGPLTMGMLNSNFIDNNDTPETMDFAGPAGLPAERTEQIRYTWPLNKANLFSVAAENPQSGYQDTRDNIEVASPTEPMPDFSIRYQYTSNLLHLQLSSVLRDVAYEDGFGNRSSHITGAAIAGATINLDAVNKAFGKDNIGAQYWTGSIGRYIPDDFGANVASVLAVDNGTTGTARTIQTKLQDDQGFAVYYQHFWMPKLRSSVTIGYNHQNLASFLPADTQNAVATKTVSTNLIWRVVPSTDLGVEFWLGQKQFQKSTGVSPKNAEKLVFGGIWHF
ncbi:MAG: hypothetical protein B7Z81_03995 [Acidocella sp. 20-61-6]|nr:MAG: hypothetical protein B7Z81_03995 [Acidocella sp. 20-61-6]